MAFPQSALDTSVEILATKNGISQFVDITTDVELAKNIEVVRGRLDQRSKVNYGTAKLTLMDRLKDGRYNDQVPTGIYYGSIGRNTPARIGVQPHWTSGPYVDSADAFGRVTASGWGTADTGGAWTVALGSGGSVLAGDYSTSSNAANMAIPAANAYRRAELRGISTIDCDTYVTIKAPLATGAALEAGVTLRGATTNTYVLFKIAFETTNAITATITNRAATATSSAATGITHSGTGQPIRMRARTIGPYCMMKVWVASSSEPTDWLITYDDAADLSGPSAGYPGLYAGALTGNTNVKPVTLTFDDWVATPELGRLFGEVIEWPTEWDTSGEYVTAPIEIAGVRRRLNVGAQQLKSPMRRLIESTRTANVEGGLRQYWACEDGSGALQAASAIGQPPLKVFSSNSTYPTFGSGGPAGSDGCMKLVAGNGLRGELNGSNASTAFTFAFCVNMPSAPGGNTQIVNFEMTGSDTSHRYWVFTIFPSGGTDTIGLEIFDATGVLQTVVNTANFTIASLNERYGRDLTIWISGRQNGSSVDYEWMVEDYVIGAMASTGGSFVGTLGYGQTLQLTNDFTRTDWEYSHLAWFDDDLDGTWGLLDMPELGYAQTGYAGETAATRFARLCDEESVRYVTPSSAELTGTSSMGVQAPAKLIDLLEECADVDQGVVHETRQTMGLRFRTSSSLYNQSAGLSIDYSLYHLSGQSSPRPINDDQTLSNDVEVRRKDGTGIGSSFHTSLTTGRLSTAAPPSGVGQYARDRVTVNVETDDQLPHVAGWLLHKGTWDAPRWRAIGIELARSVWLASPTMSAQAVGLDTGDLASIANTPTWVKPGPHAVMIEGYVETIRNRSWEIVYDSSPGDLWSVADLGDVNLARLDSNGTYVAVAATSSAASLKLAITNTDTTYTGNNNIAPWTTSVGAGFYLNIAGEKVLVSAMANTAIAFGSVGTAAHANNASVTPGAPASRAAGDLLLMPAAIRTTSGLVTEPSGYSTLWTSGNVKVFARIATNTAADLPTVSFTGGAAGDDTSAQIARFTGLFSNVSSLLVNSVSATNGSAQDIAVPGIKARWDNCLGLYIGWKQDDYTSVTSPGTEISEASTVTGNDQSFVWSYVIQTTAALINASTFTVTGGAAAVSKAGVLLIRSDTQTATVTRAVNGVSKAIAASAPAKLWTPFRLAR